MTGMDEQNESHTRSIIMCSWLTRRPVAAVPFRQGYNDGLSAVEGSTGVEPALTPAVAAASDVQKVSTGAPSETMGGSKWATCLYF